MIVEGERVRRVSRCLYKGNTKIYLSSRVVLPMKLFERLLPVSNLVTRRYFVYVLEKTVCVKVIFDEVATSGGGHNLRFGRLRETELCLRCGRNDNVSKS